MKKTYKIFYVIVLMLMLISICTNVFATGVTIDGVKNSGTTDTGANEAMQKIGGTIIGYVTNAAIVISVVMIAVLGIKYMLGSAEEKSDYKKSFLPLLIGAVLVFGAATIAKVIVGLAGNF